MVQYSALELQMLKRKIVHVLDWFDDEHEIPWNYVERNGGKCEAFTTVITWSIEDNCEMAEPISLGLFNDVKAAATAIRHYNRLAEAMKDLRGVPDGFD